MLYLIVSTGMPIEANETRCSKILQPPGRYIGVIYWGKFVKCCYKTFLRESWKVGIHPAICVAIRF